MSRQIVDPLFVVKGPIERDDLQSWGTLLAQSLTRNLTDIAQALNHLASVMGIEGEVKADGTINVGNQFASAKVSTGRYTVTIKDYGTKIIPNVSPIATTERRVSIDAIAQTGFTVRFWDSASVLIDTPFAFTIRGYMESVGG